MLPSTKFKPAEAVNAERTGPIGRTQSITNDHGIMSHPRDNGFKRPNWFNALVPE
jgi:hypothetical protein